MSTVTPTQSANRVVRCAAAVVDLALVLVLSLTVVWLGRAADTYIPLELTFLLIWVLQAVLLTAGWQRTAGKWLLGLRVERPDGNRPGVLRILAREAVVRLLAPLALLPRSRLLRGRCGWIDLLADTCVVEDAAAARRRWWAQWSVAAGLLVLLGVAIAPRARLFARAARMTPGQPAAVAPSGASRPSVVRLPPREVHSVASDEYSEMSRWLDAHSRRPEEYALAVAATHQLTIFGELHHIGDNLRFLARLIPELYHRAGVRCLAMEALVADDDEALQRVVTATEFDRGAAVTLARHEGWKTWGSREYVDVVESVWALNRTLPAGQPPMRLIGLDREWDLPSWALVGIGDDARPGPPWERLRLVRVLLDLPLLAKRDELMAWELEQEVFVSGQRGVAWVGAAHAYTDYAPPLVSGEGGSQNSNPGRKYRLGAILRQRHGVQVFHIRMHDSDFEAPTLVALLEAVQALRGHAPAGFDLSESPFANLRDNGGFEYRRDPTARLADFAGGYVYLLPVASRQHCAWETGFITRAMFLRDRPYYEAQTGRRLRDAQEADDAFRRKWAE